MRAIYSSKLFKASPRKDKIVAALNDPLNKELVTQLRTYLDEEYQVHNVEEDDRDIEVHEPPQSTSDSFEPAPAGGGGFSSGPSGFGTGEFGDNIGEDDNEPDEGFNEDGTGEFGPGSADITEDGEEVDEPEQDIETSTQIDSVALTENDLTDIVNVLENNPETCGVSRISQGEEELWIYYSDTTNLNKVMTPVIEILYGQGWTQLEFNRLARSSNAIVFEVV